MPEVEVADLPYSKKPCKRVRSARKIIEQKLAAEHYRQVKAEDLHKKHQWMPSPNLEQEQKRQQAALDSKNRADAARTEKARAYNRLKAQGKLKGLDDFQEGDGQGAAP